MPLSPRIRPALSLAALALALGAVPACRERPAPPPSASATPPSSASPSAPPPTSAASADTKRPDVARPLNVLFLMIDSLRWDMPWAGYPREIAPRLGEFAKKWALYPRSYALSSYTAKSVVPTLAGKYPGEMPRSSRFFTVWAEENVLVSELAQKAGHRTLSGHGHGYFLPGMGINQGFDDYQLLKGTFLDLTGVKDVNSDRLYTLARQMLEKPENTALGEGKRFFAYFHFLDPHYSYNRHPPPHDFGPKRRDLYDSEVHFTDEWVGKLIDFVLEQPWAKDTAIIITADHGEGFGEHNHYRHAYEIWESLVRVPLLIRLPGAAPRRIELPRGHIDLAATMADLMQLDAGGLRGKSLVPELLGAEPEPRPVLVDLPRADLMDRRRALIDGDYKLIVFGDNKSFELYEVVSDPKEEKELSEQAPEKLAELKQKFDALTARIPETPVTDSGPLKGAPPGQRW